MRDEDVRREVLVRCLALFDGSVFELTLKYAWSYVLHCVEEYNGGDDDSGFL